MDELRRLVIIGDVGGLETYHVGDEAMLCANIEGLRRLPSPPACTAVSADPEATSRMYGIDAVPLIGFQSETDEPRRHRLWNQLMESLAAFKKSRGRRGMEGGAIEALGKSDGLIVSGGGNLCSTWPGHLYERVALIRIAHELGKPVVLAGQTIGPHLVAEEFRLLSEHLKMARLVGVRERPSKALAESLGVPEDRICYQLDDAFRLQPQPAEDLRSLAEGRPWIAVTISSFPYFEAPGFLESLAQQLAAVSIATGAKLVFVPHVAAPENSGVWADAEIGRRLAKLMEPSVSMRVLDVLDCRQVCWLTGKASMVISARYHPLVFGMAGGVPGIGIHVDRYTRVKLQGALAHAGLQDWTMPMELCLAGLLEKGATELWDRRWEVIRHLDDQEESWIQLERRRWSRLCQALELQPAQPDQHRLSEAVLSSDDLDSCSIEDPPVPLGAWAYLAAEHTEKSEKQDRRIRDLESELLHRGVGFLEVKKALRLLLAR